MDKIKFYGDWIYYGGLSGIFASLIVYYLVAKKIGSKNVKGRHYITIIVVCLLPTILLPLWLCPASLVFKFGVTV